jgi:hypothetical protein
MTDLPRKRGGTPVAAHYIENNGAPLVILNFRLHLGRYSDSGMPETFRISLPAAIAAILERSLVRELDKARSKGFLAEPSAKTDGNDGQSP